MIIGLTGSFCSGKDTIADYLVRKKRFLHHSLSDELRDELKTMGIKPLRENLIKIGTRLRHKAGNGILAKRVMKKLGEGRDYVITSIRHSAEIRELKKNKNFHLINVDAPARVRFGRMLNRNRPGDPRTFKKFLKLEKIESTTKGSGQQLCRCAKLADINFVNDCKSLVLLHKNIDALLERIGR